MTTLDIKLSLPESLAVEAARLGLLEPENLRALLADAVRTKRPARLAEARAHAIVSGDRHLLALAAFRDIPVLTPAEALARISAGR